VAYNRIKKQRGCAPLTVLWRLHSGRPSHPTLVARLGRGSMPLSPCFLPINTGEERAEKGRRMVWDREKNHKKKTIRKKQGNQERNQKERRRNRRLELPPAATTTPPAPAPWATAVQHPSPCLSSSSSSSSSSGAPLFYKWTVERNPFFTRLEAQPKNCWAGSGLIEKKYFKKFVIFPRIFLLNFA